MANSDVFTLGLGLNPPWRVVDQRLETGKQPNELHLAVAAEPGARFPCPTCGRSCKPHDWKEMSWRHLNFFQHACFVSARIPRTDCPDHGVLRINVPWARPDSGFTLLFEQAALSLMREMPVAAAARIIGVTDQRLWRVLFFYIDHHPSRSQRRPGHCPRRDRGQTRPHICNGVHRSRRR
jgi:hypothetical protein